MTTVGAYIDLGAWEKVVPRLYAPGTDYIIGDLEGKNEDGLEVNWGITRTPPSGAQVYVYWEPTVIAVWDVEEENDEESNGTEVGTTGNANDEESNWGAE